MNQSMAFLNNDAEFDRARRKGPEWRHCEEPKATWQSSGRLMSCRI